MFYILEKNERYFMAPKKYLIYWSFEKPFETQTLNNYNQCIKKFNVRISTDVKAQRRFLSLQGNFPLIICWPVFQTVRLATRKQEKQAMEFKWRTAI